MKIVTIWNTRHKPAEVRLIIIDDSVPVSPEKTLKCGTFFSHGEQSFFLSYCSLGNQASIAAWPFLPGMLCRGAVNKNGGHNSGSWCQGCFEYSEVVLKFFSDICSENTHRDGTQWKCSSFGWCTWLEALSLHILTMAADKVFTTRNFEGERRSIPLPIQTYFWRQTR